MKKLLLKRWLIVFSLGLLSGPLARAQSSGPRTAVSLDGATGLSFEQTLKPMSFPCSNETQSSRRQKPTTPAT